MDFLSDPANLVTGVEEEEVVDDSEEAAAPETPEPVEEPAKPESKPVEAVANPDLEALIAQYAKEEGLDPTQPKDLRLMRRLAEKELHIRRSKSAPSETQKGAMDLVNELFDEPKAETEGKPPAEAKPKAEAAEEEADPVFTLADSFKSSTDAEQAYMDLIADASATSEQIARAGDAAFVYRMRKALPAIDEIVEARVRAALDPYITDLAPVLSQSKQAAMSAEREGVIDRLKSRPEYAEIDTLFAKQSEQTLEIDGGTFPDTPLNRAIAEAPWIMQIKVEDPNLSAEQNRKRTLAQRYAAAWKIAKSQQNSIDPKTREGLVEIGAAAERNKQQDQVRQGLNSGRAGVAGGTKAEGKASSLWSTGDESVPMSSLFK